MLLLAILGLVSSAPLSALVKSYVPHRSRVYPWVRETVYPRYSYWSQESAQGGSVIWTRWS